MKRIVSMSRDLAKLLLQHRQRAKELGVGKEFRLAWQKIWESLQTRPLPPDESPDTFGDIRFTTRHPPVHHVCVACVDPLAVNFAVHRTEQSGEPLLIVTITRVAPSFH